MRWFAVAPLLGVLMTGITHAHVEVPEHLIDPTRPRFEAPEAVLQRFFTAVDRGELIVHGLRIDRPRLLPLQVEYLYDLTERTTQIKLFVDLKPPLPMGDGPFSVMSIDVTMEGDDIVEIESHIWTKP